jgi:hypothetical protein
MTSPRSDLPPAPPKAEPPAAETGVPGFRTWRGVYTFVVLCFAGLVALLAWLTQTFAP